MSSLLVQHQHLFLMDVAKLIQSAAGMGYTVTGGELYRPPELQELWFKQGKSQIKTGGNHGKRLAIDLNIFNKDGILATLDQIRPLGIFWEGLNKLNRWGGNFPTLRDGPHFERNAP